MSFQFACDTKAAPTINFGRPNCPSCGSVMLMAEESIVHMNDALDALLSSL